MADKSAISWTESTWNPATGCDKVSSGCKNCYAELVALKLQHMGQPKYRNGFKYTEHPKELDKPIQWKTPRKIFVNSMSDLFHPDATLDFVNRVFETMMIAKQHIYQILTKRPENMKIFVEGWLSRNNVSKVPGHIWLGTSVENQSTVHRIKTLKQTPITIRFVSFEPLLGLIDDVDLHDIHWAIIGGESGPKYRPVKKEWVVTLRKLCLRDGAVFYFKQWGGLRATSGGCKLDGKEYHDYPEIPRSPNLDTFL